MVYRRFRKHQSFSRDSMIDIENSGMRYERRTRMIRLENILDGPDA